jgi:phage gpG-like protein
MAQDQFKFGLYVGRYKSVSLDMMREIAMANKNYFLQSFKRQGWDGKKWQEVNRRIKGTKEYEYPKNKGLRRRTREILVGRGQLRRQVNSSIKLVGPTKIIFSVDLPYAAIHNQGGKMKGGKTMPKRPYMGESMETKELTTGIIKKYANKVFNK